MKVIKFRTVPDIEEDVFRDITIGADRTLEDLYSFIIKTYEFRGDQMASFYMSNNDWDKGHEIALMDMGGPSDSDLPVEMNQAVLDELIVAENQKLLLVYDFLKMWCFYVEVLDISHIPDATGEPEVAMVFGDVPNEDDKEMADMMEGVEMDDKKKSDYEDLYDDFDDDFEGGEFENIDDLDI